MNCIIVAALLAIAAAPALASSQSGNDAELGIKWSIASIGQNEYKVSLSSANLEDKSYIAIGLSHTPDMINAFIIDCVKFNGRVNVQSRYALEHALPPIASFGLKKLAAAGNECVATIPAKLVHAQQPQPILLGSDSQKIYVLLSKGNLDSAGELQYHGQNRKVLGEALHLA